MKNELDKTERVNISLPKVIIMKIEILRNSGLKVNVSKIARVEIEKFVLNEIRKLNLKNSIKKFCNSEEITERELKEYFTTRE